MLSKKGNGVTKNMYFLNDLNAKPTTTTTITNTQKRAQAYTYTQWEKCVRIAFVCHRRAHVLIILILGFSPLFGFLFGFVVFLFLFFFAALSTVNPFHVLSFVFSCVVVFFSLLVRGCKTMCIGIMYLRESL